MKKNVMDGACSTHGGEMCTQGFLVGKPEGKRPLGRPRHRWEDNFNPYPANMEDMVSS